MRQDTRLEWEILEAEQGEWEEVAASVTAGKHRTEHRQWLMAACSAIPLFIAMAGTIAFRLWQDAEAGIAATERHIGTLVEVETIRQQPLTVAHELSASVDEVTLKGSAAMVRVVVTETSSSGQILPHVETRFYEHYPAGWRRTGPIAAFWGDPAILETPTLHFDFYELDRPFVEAVAGPVDAYHAALRQILGLPSIAASGRVTVAVTSSYFAPGTVLPDGTLIEPSPYLYFAGPPGHEGPLLYAEAETTLLRRLQAQLLTRTIQESRDVYGMQVMWQQLARYLEQWLRDHAAELPALVDGEPLQDEGRFVEPDYVITVLTGEYLSNLRFPEYTVQRSNAIAYAADAFFDFIVASRGPDAIPPLLAAFDTQDSWAALVDEAYGLSMDELLAQWEAYAERSRSNDSGGG